MTRIGATATHVPEHRPPPPIGVTTTSRSGISCVNSSAAVPAPAITRSSSKGWISTAPVRSSTSASTERRASSVLSHNEISAPYRRTAVCFAADAFFGMTTYAGMPRVSAASASAAA